MKMKRFGIILLIFCIPGALHLYGGQVEDASDATMVRRIHLALTGRLPASDEAKEFVQSKEPDKYPQLVDRLLASEGFVEYWSMKWMDALRVKSEFPINLWPNAVYVYQRRIERFLRDNEPYDHFARSLLLSSGSNFRVPEVNFYRALPVKNSETIAAMVARTWMGVDFQTLSEEERRNMTAFFDRVAYKPTREWKEEIVYLLPEEESRNLILPDGQKVVSAPGMDVRKLFVDDLTAPGNNYFAANGVAFVWRQFFGQTPPDPAAFAMLKQQFIDSGYDFRKLCRMAALLPIMRKVANGRGDGFPIHRLDAEVIDDMIGDLTLTRSRYSSVIPEPFSFIPEERRTVTLADGSVSSSFLILFGRSPRDSGLASERNQEISVKQRLYLFNSGELYRKLRNINGREEIKKLRPREKIVEFYWLFFSRPPEKEELQAVLDSFNQITDSKEKWRFWQDLAWVLVNTSEFLYQH